MAFIRSLSRRATVIKRQHHPSLSYILHNSDDGDNQKPVKATNAVHHKYYWSSLHSGLCGSNFMRRSDFYIPSSAMIGASLCRSMSTTVGGGSENIELMRDVAEVLGDTALPSVASQPPVVNEVAVAAADSFLPIQILQHFIDNVHSYAGVNWWAAVAISTLLIRTATIPLLINQLKSSTKLTLIRPRVEAIKEEIQNKGMDPQAVAEGQKRMNEIFKEHGVSPFTPLKGLLIQGPLFVCFFLAISNMVEKVSSFKTGGAFWFTDLTTPDSLYILPILSGLSILITVESNLQEGMEGNPAARTMKTVSRIFAVASVPLTMNFPKAIFFYWLTSNMFSLAYGSVLKLPGVKKFLGIPEIPVTPTTNTQNSSSFNLLSALKQATAGRQEPSPPLPNEASSKLSDQRRTSSSVISHRIRSLEKEVKGRKKNKKR